MASGDIKQSQVASSAFTFRSNLQSMSASSTVGEESDSIDNSSNLYLDDVIQGVFSLADTTAPSSSQAIYIYVAGSIDGTNWTDNATGSKAAITIKAPTNLRLAVVLSCPDGSTRTRVTYPMSIAQLFGGQLPKKYNIIVINDTGRALASSAQAVNHMPTYNTVTP